MWIGETKKHLNGETYKMGMLTSVTFKSFWKKSLISEILCVYFCLYTKGMLGGLFSCVLNIVMLINLYYP